MKKNITVRIGAIVMVLMVAFFSILPDLVSAEGDDTEPKPEVEVTDGISWADDSNDDAQAPKEDAPETAGTETGDAEAGSTEDADLDPDTPATEIPDSEVTDGSEAPTEPTESTESDETDNTEDPELPEDPSEGDTQDDETLDTEAKDDSEADVPSGDGEEDDTQIPSEGDPGNTGDSSITVPQNPVVTDDAQAGAESGEMDTIDDYIDILSNKGFKSDSEENIIRKMSAGEALMKLADLFESDEDDFIISEDGTTVLGYSNDAPGGVVKIPDKITAIGDGAFMGRTIITGIIFPPNLQSIGSSAFDGCSGLGSVSVPDTVTSVGASAFANCTGLSEVYSGAGTGTVSPNEFSNCISLQSVAVPEGVSSIAAGAFSGCSNLGSISLPSTLESLDMSAFSGDSNLASVTVASGVYSSYDGCVYTADGSRLLFCPQGKTGISFSAGMRTVASGAFSGCNYLLSAVIPNAAGTIEADAFSGSAIKTVTIPAGVTVIGSQSGWTPNVVYGYRGTTAETWARQSNYVFESLDKASDNGNGAKEEHIEDSDTTDSNGSGSGGSSSAKPGTSTPQVNLGSSGANGGASVTISRNTQGRVNATPKTGVEDYGVYFLFGGIFLVGIALIAFSKKMRFSRTK